ncbi:hypothetical protein [Bradyrhizobium sp.]|uniref:hypothetical protein n=1 Tax=Bradyrhizobium sp. TaxID=376 RepID=UPI0025BCB016|nr:hypothetical protein [Bradyrhizobium sp.]
MIAPPNAISQGSNGAGGGALTAFTAMSAARADPDTIASAVANKAIFFIWFPITFQTQSDFRRPRGKRQPTATKSLQTRRNLERLPKTVKQKKQTSADFLGVWAFS